MDHRFARTAVAIALSIAVASCSKDSNPAQPTTTTATTTTEGVDATASVTVPRAVSPATGAQIKNLDQPVTLVIANAVITQSATPTYTFEIASDVSFANKVYTKTGVAQGAGGQTSLTADRLGPGADYFWHARAEGGGTVGPFSTPRGFTIGQAIVIGTATPISPINSADTNARPTLAVNNASRSGPVGPLVYRFELATNSGFTPVAITANVAEGSVRTTYTPPADLSAETPYYWRVTVTDPTNGVNGATSAFATFSTTLSIDLRKVVVLKGPSNFGDWAQTANLTLVEQDGAGDGPLCMQYTDPGWPDVPWPYGGDDPNFGIYANQWYFAKINGVWYGGAGEWIYRGAGSCKAGQGTRTIGPDSGFGAPFSNWVPQVGELVGFAVSASARNYPGMFSVAERSNVIVQAWRDTSLGSRIIASRR